MSTAVPAGFIAPPCIECGDDVTETHFVIGRAVLLAAIPAVVHRKCFTASTTRMEAEAVRCAEETDDAARRDLREEDAR